MTVRESIGYLVAGLVLLYHVGLTTVAVRLDWLAFGSMYQQQQQQMIAAINQLGADMQALKTMRGLTTPTPVPR